MSNSDDDGMTAWQCAVCGEAVDNREPFPWRCPNATPSDPFHVLHLLPPSARSLESGVTPIFEQKQDVNPFVRYGARLAWWDFAIGNGMSTDECVALTERVADGFRIDEAVSRRVGLVSGGLRAELAVF